MQQESWVCCQQAEGMLTALFIRAWLQGGVVNSAAVVLTFLQARG
jgi:hypothetical protein